MSTSATGDLEARPRFDGARARRAKGPRFPDGFDVAVDGAVAYVLRLIPSNRIVGRWAVARDAWPEVVAEIERGVPSRCLVLDWELADGTRGRLASGRGLVSTARAGLGVNAVIPPARVAS